MWGRRGRAAGWFVEQQQYRQLSRVGPQQEQPEQQEQQQGFSPRPILPAYGQNVWHLRMLDAYQGQERRLLPPNYVGKYKKTPSVLVTNEPG